MSLTKLARSERSSVSRQGRARSAAWSGVPPRSRHRNVDGAAEGRVRTEADRTGPAARVAVAGGWPMDWQILGMADADFFEVVRRIALARSAIPEGSRASSTGIRARSSCASA